MLSLAQQSLPQMWHILQHTATSIPSPAVSNNHQVLHLMQSLALTDKAGLPSAP